MIINIILATDINNGIGKNNNIPWLIKKDLSYFKDLSSFKNENNNKNAVLMGRKTWDSIPNKFKPLNNRINIIISSNNSIVKNENNDIIIINQLDIEIIKKKCEELNIKYLWIIGGSKIYNYFLENKIYNYIFLTRIYHNFNCDIKVNIDKYLNNNLILSDDYYDNNIKYNFNIYSRKNTKVPDQLLDYSLRTKYIKNKIDNNVDNLYLNIIKNIINFGEKRETRNSNTISKFGEYIEIDISNKFPLLTTKKIYWKGILHELLWFLNSNTNSKDLESNSVNIWKGNTSREYLDSINLDYIEGYGGPIYGWQWRNFGKKYIYISKDGVEKVTNGFNEGFDQLNFIINEIKTNPTSRRLFMSGWNPNQMKDMCLPPCHVSYQFYVQNGGLSCQMYQRSADVFLGLPFNIASTALLCYIIADLCNLKPMSIKMCIGDAHIYENHINQINQQLKLENNYFELPKLLIKGEHNKLEDYKYDDFELKDYLSHPLIKANMIA